MNRYLEQKFMQELENGRGWMRFLGIMAIIQGVICCITIVGAIFGWAYIWLGMVALEANRQAKCFEVDRSEESSLRYLQQIQKFFRIFGYTIILSLVLMVLAVAASIILPYFGVVPPNAGIEAVAPAVAWSAPASAGNEWAAVCRMGGL